MLIKMLHLPKHVDVKCVFEVKGGGPYPAAAAASLLLLLLFNELHGRGRGRGGSHGSDHLDAVLRQRGQVQALPAPHLHLLELLETPQGELGDGGRRRKHSDSQAYVQWIEKSQVDVSSSANNTACRSVEDVHLCLCRCFEWLQCANQYCLPEQQ